MEIDDEIEQRYEPDIYTPMFHPSRVTKNAYLCDFVKSIAHIFLVAKELTLRRNFVKSIAPAPCSKPKGEYSYILHNRTGANFTEYSFGL
uniref:Uncharacterized protein n=1 Tax=Arundo donax TaxID=35708 RepID=A0A0A9GG63_ARUDO